MAMLVYLLTGQQTEKGLSYTRGGNLTSPCGSSWAYPSCSQDTRLRLPFCLQEEGIVVKAARSPWRCNDRGNAWLKIKPDYLQVTTCHITRLRGRKRH